MSDLKARNTIESKKKYQKIKLFHVITVLMLFFFALNSILQALITMVIYEKNTNNDNNNVWQTHDFVLNCNILGKLMGIAYHIAKILMYFAFVIRLRIAYDNSAYAYPDMFFSFDFYFIFCLCVFVLFACACVFVPKHKRREKHNTQKKNMHTK